ncbi:MAG: 3-hydroxyacyl-CoA dehydrogenase NAD-binding domain-containing protein [Gemmatimonadales bacterium]
MTKTAKRTPTPRTKGRSVGGGPLFRSVAVVGTGVIGRSWIQVFARAGCSVKVFDADPNRTRTALEWMRLDLAERVAEGSLSAAKAKAMLKRVRPAASLEEALDGVGYVQESGPESLDAKQSLYRAMDRCAAKGTVIGSSTSAIDMTRIARGLPGAHRCIVAHPVNPPHVIPAVEILGGKRTSPRVVSTVVRFMRELGQTPVLLHKFTPGFVLNRMQAALVREALDLVASGVCDVQAVEDSIRDGLGLRWALMGPFGVANTNADGGVQEYFTRYGPSYATLWRDLNDAVRLDRPLLARIGRQTARLAPEPLAAQRTRRDRLVEAIRSLKGGQRQASGAKQGTRSLKRRPPRRIKS